MTSQHLAAPGFDRRFGSNTRPLPRPGRDTMQLIRRVHWRIYPFRVPKILAALALVGLVLWSVPATRGPARAAAARVGAAASAALVHARVLLQGSGPEAK